MTSHVPPTPEALASTVPHFSAEALAHLIAAITRSCRHHPNVVPRAWRSPNESGSLAYLREGCRLGAGPITSIPNTTLRDNINPVLAAFDPARSGAARRHRDRELRRRDPMVCQEGKVIIDGTDFTVARPGDQDLQRPFYSGKRKTHTTKTIAVCDSSSNLMWVTPLVAGATTT
ncbi:MAG: hypothetical protein IPG97_10990 [Microthrixaceae bacterium]|nr:hypothetical protein [Microthrixaceae bacterium]